MFFRQIKDDKLAQYAYLIGCQATGEALLIDPERDIDHYLELAEAEGLTITAVAETHIHADFLSGARELAERFGMRVYLSDEGGPAWTYEWAKGGDYDCVLLKDGDTFNVGKIEVEAAHTPGHTPEHLSFLITDRGGGASEPMGVATGDFVFVGDLGRPDLLESTAGIQGMRAPSARRLFASVQEFLELPDFLQVWPAHGAGSSCGKALGAVPESTVGYEKRFSRAIDAARRGEEAFVEFILKDQPEPPLYFARMKRCNKLGVPILGDLPRPRKLTAKELDHLAARDDVLIVDTRIDRSAFMGRHLPRSLYAPLTRTFTTVVGSLVEDETTPIYLVVSEDRVEEAVRDLVRVGYDEIAGFIDADMLERYFQRGGRSERIEEIDFGMVASMRGDRDRQVVDVRYASEHAAGHVPGALNASYTRLPEHEADLPRDRTLLVHCASGARSAVASAFLARTGRKVLYVNDTFATYERIGPIEQRVPVGV